MLTLLLIFSISFRNERQNPLAHCILNRNKTRKNVSDCECSEVKALVTQTLQPLRDRLATKQMKMAERLQRSRKGFV